MALALNASAHGNSAGSTTVAATITTTVATVILACITTNGAPITGISGGGLTWTFKSTVGTFTNIQELWYAVAASPLSAQAITVTQTSSNFITVDLVAISGSHTSTIFDGAAVTGLSAPLSISTSTADTFIIGTFRNSGASPTQGAGWTKISGADFELTEYQIVSSTQSSLSVSMGSGTSASCIAIAVKIAAGGGGGISQSLLIPQTMGLLIGGFGG